MIVKVLMLLLGLQFTSVDSCAARPEGTCEVGWMKFSRKAESICDGFGAELSSIEDTDMRYEFKSAMSDSGITGRGAWVGIAECNCGAAICLKLSGCGSGSYYWTDAYSYPNDLLDTKWFSGLSAYVPDSGVLMAEGEMVRKFLIFLLCLHFPSYVESCGGQSCEDGWTYYKRNTTGWCMKVVAQQNINKAEAKKVCSDLGAVISSIDDSAMNDRLLNLKSITGATKIWLGADMKSECLCGEELCLTTPDCPNGYYWSDGYTTSNDYISNNLIMFSLDININNVYVMKYYPSDGLIMNSIPELENVQSTGSYDSVICGKISNF
ncbi:unnamed protein product [Caenorhabditis angaria]|uniref:C-type lectin domain-containing protein n=1 Tax=Caenorhabditis angaria TaxID=860376 RepID=A0A9P1I7Y7_9PELO|nr:unnamed protein product [Caenorhabditis angaria]